MNHPIHFVSLGPGDPELITLKGLKTLQKADIIYCPATQGKHGIISRATDILKAIEVDESLIHPFILPMSKERTDALNAYNELFLDAQAEYLKATAHTMPYSTKWKVISKKPWNCYPHEIKVVNGKKDVPPAVLQPATMPVRS